MTGKTKWILIGAGGLIIILVIGVVLWQRSANSQFIDQTKGISSGSQTQTKTQAAQTTSTGADTDEALVKKTLAEDPDQDGVTTEQEKILGTDPNKRDTDGDSYADGDEVSFYKTDPKKKNTPAEILALVQAMPDSPMKTQWLNAYQSQTTTTTKISPLLDSDNDSLTDQMEIDLYKTDPNKADTDGDGFSDAEEVRKGYNPLGTGTCPQLYCFAQ